MRTFLAALFITLPCFAKAQVSSFVNAPGGNVGIATSTPAALFTVGNGTLAVTSTGNVGIYTASPSGALDVEGPAGRNVILNTGGNVGIGTTSPGALLSVIGGAVAIGTTTALSGAILDIKTATNHHLDVVNITNSAGILGLNDSNDYAQLAIDGSTVVLNANSGGNVGIGTVNPATLLDVNGPAQFGSGAAKSTFSTTGALTLAADAALALSGASGDITTASSVTASAFFGDGSHLTGIAASGAQLSSTQTFTGYNVFSSTNGIGGTVHVSSQSVVFGTGVLSGSYGASWSGCNLSGSTLAVTVQSSVATGRVYANIFVNDAGSPSVIQLGFLIDGAFVSPYSSSNFAAGNYISVTGGQIQVILDTQFPLTAGTHTVCVGLTSSSGSTFVSAVSSVPSIFRLSADN